MPQTVYVSCTAVGKPSCGNSRAPFVALTVLHLVTRTLCNSVRLAVVLGHVGVDKVHDVWADRHREHGRQGRRLLSRALRRKDRHYGTGRHGFGCASEWGKAIAYPWQDDRKGQKPVLYPIPSTKYSKKSNMEGVYFWTGIRVG